MILPSKDWNQILSRFFPQLSQPRIRNSTQKSSYGDFRHRTSTLFPTQCQVCLIAWTRFHPGSGHAFAIHHATPVPRTVQPKGIIHSFMAYILDRGETDRRIISLNGGSSSKQVSPLFLEDRPGTQICVADTKHVFDTPWPGIFGYHLKTPEDELGKNNCCKRSRTQRYTLQTHHRKVQTSEYSTPYHCNS